MILNDNIKLIRELSGKTQAQFAKLIKSNLSNVKTYETSDVRPKAPVLAAISDFSGVSIEELEKRKLSHKDLAFQVERVDEKREESNAAGPLPGSITLQDHIALLKQWREDAEAKYQDAKAEKERLSRLIEKNLDAVLLSLGENRNTLGLLKDQIYIATAQLESQREALEGNKSSAAPAAFVKKGKGAGVGQQNGGKKGKDH